MTLPPSQEVGSVWRGFRARHLSDYPDRAVWVWCGGVLLGSVVLRKVVKRPHLTKERLPVTAFAYPTVQLQAYSFALYLRFVVLLRLILLVCIYKHFEIDTCLGHD